MKKLITTEEVSGQAWRDFSPNNCPIILKDGDGKSAGACWHYLHDGKCPSHGQIYETEAVIELTWTDKIKKWILGKCYKI